MASEGDLIAGKYKIVSPLGKGGMSQVWLARDVQIDTKLGSEKFWAIKEIKKRGTDDNGEELMQSLIAEASLMTKLDHPALPRILDIIDDGVTIYVVMDYIAGDSLDKALIARGRSFSVDDVIAMGVQLCDVLEYLHTREKPVIYRDMKPGNIMWNNGTARLIDFGIAREYKENKSNDTKIGYTPAYAAPEQLDQSAQSDARTDIYCLGATLFHLVTGKNPGKAPFIVPIRQWNPQLPEGLERIIEKATQKDPSKRYQSCAEMRYDLEHYEVLTAEYEGRQKGKLKLFYGSLVAAAVCLVLGIGCTFASAQMRSSTYESYIQTALTASTEEVNGQASAAETAYANAIKVDPSSSSAWLSLLEDVYKADNKFTTTEEARFNALWNAHLNDINSSEDYAKLNYQVGILYFIYYDYGDAKTRGTQAVPWFRRASESYDQAKSSNKSITLTAEEASAAKIYTTIGGFYQAIDKAASEGDDQHQVYADFWEAFESAYTNLKDSDKDIVKLRLYQLIFQSVNAPTYLNGFMRAGVSQERVETLLTNVVTSMKSMEVVAQNSDIGTSMYREVVDGYQAALNSVKAAYKSAGAVASGDSGSAQSSSSTKNGGDK